MDDTTSLFYRDCPSADERSLGDSGHEFDLARHVEDRRPAQSTRRCRHRYRVQLPCRPAVTNSPAATGMTPQDSCRASLTVLSPACAWASGPTSAAARERAANRETVYGLKPFGSSCNVCFSSCQRRGGPEHVIPPAAERAPNPQGGPRRASKASGDRRSPAGPSTLRDRIASDASQNDWYRVKGLNGPPSVGPRLINDYYTNRASIPRPRRAITDPPKTTFETAEPMPEDPQGRALTRTERSQGPD